MTGRSLAAVVPIATELSVDRARALDVLRDILADVETGRVVGLCVLALRSGELPDTLATIRMGITPADIIGMLDLMKAWELKRLLAEFEPASHPESGA